MDGSPDTLDVANTAGGALMHPARGGQPSLATLAELGAQARVYLDAARAESTRRAYRSDWQHFTAWCAESGLEALPAVPETLVLYLTSHAGVLKAATLERRLVAITQAHRAAGHPTPVSDAGVTSVWRGIRRTIGTRQVGKAALLTDDLKAMAAVLSTTTPGGIRDRALLLVGFAGAFRRSELVALDVDDVELTREGIIITVRRSKTDQEAEGRKVGIPRGKHATTCPVRTLTAWLELLGGPGPVFRAVDKQQRIRTTRLSGYDVARIVKRTAKRAGLDPARYAGHSLRAGLATSAAAAGVEERAIMAQTGHKSVTVARRYIRDGSLFLGNAAGLIGL